MKERLIQLLDLEQLSPSKFADIIGVQRSSISHVISGRNKPSFDFLQKTLKAFPGLRNVSGNLFDTSIEPEVPSEELISETDTDHREIAPPESTLSSEAKPEATPESPVPAQNMENSVKEEAIRELTSSGAKRIVQVMVIYEDDTFRAFLPSH